MHILKRLTDKPLSERQLSKAKKQFIGQLQIANDNFENYALALGKTYARTGKHRNIDDLCLTIQSLTPQTIYDVTCDIFQDDKLTTLQYK
jgi:predicted Zn-dependent peptidase